MSILKAKSSQRYVIHTLPVVVTCFALQSYSTRKLFNCLRRKWVAAPNYRFFRIYFQSRPWHRSSLEKAYPAIQKFPTITESQVSHHAQ